ncbi:MAG: DUF2779 domain-containing protein [bacterium]|nr:DUF2779 domain-containing protein [bacterium]
MSKAMLGQTGYLAGLQCQRRLWLSANEPQLAEDRTPTIESLIAASAALELRARGLFGGGEVVSERDDVPAGAAERTRQLLADSEVSVLFGAYFELPGRTVRVDMLERAGESEWRLLRVKSAQRVKDEHLDELAYQLAVVRAAGVGIASVEVLHPDGKYRRQEGEVDWRAFFRRSDVTRDASYLAEDLPDQIEQMKSALALSEAPTIEASPHCRRPYPCRFWTHCTQSLPADWIGRLPALRAQYFHALSEAGVRTVAEIPSEFSLTRPQKNARRAILSGETAVFPELGRALVGSGPPSDYLDFEAITPEVPIFPGTRPYQTLPFQWSLHSQTPDGLTHRAFLAEGNVDPRKEFAHTLCDALRDRDLPILVYSSFEATVLEGLADAFPELKKDLERIRRRLVDLLPIARNGIYALAFEGSFSLKRVAPALDPGFSYSELDGIADGGSAAGAFMSIARQKVTRDEAERLRSQLLEYCAHDTKALIVLQQALNSCAARANTG